MTNCSFRSPRPSSVNSPKDSMEVGPSPLPKERGRARLELNPTTMMTSLAKLATVLVVFHLEEPQARRPALLWTAELHQHR